MDNYEWQQYLRMIALRCQITQLEEEVFLLIDKNFTKRSELQELAENKLGIKQETF